MELEFKPMYENIIKNINGELTKVYNAIRDMNSRLMAAGKPYFNLSAITPSGSVIMDNQALLDAISGAFAERTDLGKKTK
jgi:site-specific DNA-adenine methylase